MMFQKFLESEAINRCKEESVLFMSDYGYYTSFLFYELNKTIQCYEMRLYVLRCLPKHFKTSPYIDAA